MTADGKIADYQGSAARFGSANDLRHLQEQVALVDGVMFGANTLRAYGTTMSVSDPKLLQARAERSQPPQPVQIVVSASAKLERDLRFWQQPIPRWLLTVNSGAKLWQETKAAKFERILIGDRQRDRQNSGTIDWQATLRQLSALGLNKLAILGGGELMASFWAIEAIDELWITVCPVIFGGKTAPTPVGGLGFTPSASKKLKLLEIKQIEQEVFLHYQTIYQK